jgi:UDP-GlcNAc:undecaprenyl-phosphate GlcNAc-1-phosphate transferase
VSIEIWMATIAFAIALPVTFLLRLRTKVGRAPDFVRTPRIGGFSIVTAFILAPLILAIFSDQARHYIDRDWGQIRSLGLCGGLVFLAGARDDFRDMHWSLKFGVQIAAASILYIAGYRVGEMTLPGGGTVSLGLLDPVITVFWIVLITNAMNLIDGRDGVAAGISAMVAGTMAYVAWDLGHDLIALLFAALAGASLGFVPLNLPSARKLLGDSGAYFLGFTLAALSVAGFVDTTGRVPLYIPLVALGLPVLDTGLAYIRRYLDARPPFEADQDHMHHRIERLFRLSPLNVAIVSYAITAVFCGAALLLHTWYKSVGSAVVGLGVLVFAVVLLAMLGYGGTLWNSSRVLHLRGHAAKTPQEV